MAAQLRQKMEAASTFFALDISGSIPDLPIQEIINKKMAELKAYQDELQRHNQMLEQEVEEKIAHLKNRISQEQIEALSVIEEKKQVLQVAEASLARQKKGRHAIQQQMTTLSQQMQGNSQELKRVKAQIANIPRYTYEKQELCKLGERMSNHYAASRK